MAGADSERGLTASFIARPSLKTARKTELEKIRPDGYILYAGLSALSRHVLTGLRMEL